MTLIWCIFYNNYVFYVKVTSVSSQEIINIIKVSILIVLGHISPLPPPSPLLLIFVKRSMVWASFSGGGVNGYLRYAYSIYTGSKKLRIYQGEVELFSSVYVLLLCAVKLILCTFSFIKNILCILSIIIKIILLHSLHPKRNLHNAFINIV